jgi:hypothetical protein
MVMSVANDLLYEEKLSSNRTLALFLALAILFLALAAWRLAAGSSGILVVVFFFLGGAFLFYSLNYVILVIRLGPRSLKLIFGIFSWTVPLECIAECRLDQLP